MLLHPYLGRPAGKPIERCALKVGLTDYMKQNEINTNKFTSVLLKIPQGQKLQLP